jgi:hypothetical protein
VRFRPVQVAGAAGAARRAGFPRAGLCRSSPLSGTCPGAGTRASGTAAAMWWGDIWSLARLHGRPSPIIHPCGALRAVCGGRGAVWVGFHGICQHGRQRVCCVGHAEQPPRGAGWTKTIIYTPIGIGWVPDTQHWRNTDQKRANWDLRLKSNCLWSRRHYMLH